MRDPFKVAEEFFQRGLESLPPPPPKRSPLEDFVFRLRNPHDVGTSRPFLQAWRIFCERVLALSEPPSTQAVLDARWFCRSAVGSLEYLESIDPDSRFDLRYAIREPASATALLLLTLTGRRLSWMNDMFRFTAAFLEEAGKRLATLPLPPERVDREAAMEFARGLAPDTMRIYLEGGSVRARRPRRR
jgi:hypothetical protein